MRLWIRLSKKILLQCLRGNHKLVQLWIKWWYSANTIGCIFRQAMSTLSHAYMWANTIYMCISVCIREAQVIHTHSFSTHPKVGEFSFFRPWKPEVKMHSQIMAINHHCPLAWKVVVISEIQPSELYSDVKWCVCVGVCTHTFPPCKMNNETDFLTLDSCTDTAYSHNHRQQRFTPKDKLFLFKKTPTFTLLESCT